MDQEFNTGVRKPLCSSFQISDAAGLAKGRGFIETTENYRIGGSSEKSTSFSASSASGIGRSSRRRLR